MKNFKLDKSIDWVITILPLVIIGMISSLLMLFPQASGEVINTLRNLFVNEFGFFYILLGLGILIAAIIMAFSRFGNIKLGNLDKPRYSTFSWGSMIFTSTMAADILYWSLCEWSYYYTAAPFGMENMTAAQLQDWSSAYPLFHWGPIPWAFYILPACAYAYMFFVKGRKRQTLSEAVRPLLGKHSDGKAGRLIDVFAVCGLLAGTATTFSLATPLLSGALAKILNIETSHFLSIAILAIICFVFMVAVLKGMKAISYLANFCVVVFVLLLATFLIAGPKVYIIETGITAIGKVINNFFNMATWMDPLGISGFPQDWTIFYWAYWIAWFVATPFFIAKISEGRTIKQTILGGLACGLGGTFTSFIVFGGYGLYLQTHGILDVASMIASGVAPSAVILMIFDQLPMTNLVLGILIVAMIAFYASTFDAITMVVASYSEKMPEHQDEPRRKLRAFWSVVFLLLPVALLFSDSTLSMLQTIAIIAAFPLGIIMIMVVVSFVKDLRKDHPQIEGDIR
ncbi:BCCT family transporter [Dielma fastidiosa]|uniref:BCCT family transporter n=1 Tax=Dielma fastidiosa TaxID=1034346 RepID=UPI000E4C10DC|nr:BCCT family transporter [Dielma fastidiosa]RHN00254.1 BCCT family transporter [Dielma fastidiosa]